LTWALSINAQLFNPHLLEMEDKAALSCIKAVVLVRALGLAGNIQCDIGHHNSTRVVMVATRPQE
jgi:hypothetical protein